MFLWASFSVALSSSSSLLSKLLSTVRQLGNPKQPVAEGRLHQEEAFNFLIIHRGLCQQGKHLQVDSLNGRDLCFGDNLRAGMKISLKESVAFRLCRPHICEGFNFFCQKGYLLIAKYLVYFSSRITTERTKVNLDVVC